MKDDHWALMNTLETVAYKDGAYLIYDRRWEAREAATKYNKGIKRGWWLRVAKIRITELKKGGSKC